MQYRIGDRDPVTGLYDVIHPDGSFTRNGIKIFNSAHEFGDVVLATQRSDGMMILDGVKATLTEVVNTSFTLGGFGEKPVGYLNGQVFNNEDDVILPTVSIEFAPGSPTELAPGAGDFVVRIKIDRPQRRNLRVKCELSGTAASSDYTYTGLDDDLFAVIPAGELYFDVVLAPNEQALLEVTIILAVVASNQYLSGNQSIVATITQIPTPIQITMEYASNTTGKVFGGSGTVQIKVTASRAPTEDLLLPFSVVNFSGFFGQWTSSSFLNGWSQFPVAVIPAGITEIDLSISSVSVNLGVEDKTIGLNILPDGYSQYPKYEFIGSGVFLTATTNPRFKNIILKYIYTPFLNPGGFLNIGGSSDINFFSFDCAIYASSSFKTSFPIEKNTSPSLTPDLEYLGGSNVLSASDVNDTVDQFAYQFILNIDSLAQLNTNNRQFIYLTTTLTDTRVDGNPHASNSFGKLALQRTASLMGTRGIDFANPYFIDEGIRYGWIDLQPTDNFVLTQSQTTIYYTYWSWCVRIDTQDNYNMTFIEVLISMTPTGNNIFKINHRALTINA